MQVNPSINISIGGYGGSCNNSFHNHYNERETDLRYYASFYHFQADGHALEYESINDKSFKNKMLLSDELDRDAQFALPDVQYFFKEFINKAYNNQINLLDQLTSDVNFKIVNVNLIFGSFEDANAGVVDNLAKNIKELSDEGMISNVVVKAFVILSRDGDLLKPQEEVTAFNTLEKIKDVQEGNRSIFSNIIFIDDKNTSAVYLGINTRSIGLVLNEFVTYLMTNHYNMIGNLMNSDLLSLGIGLTYFDHIYFQKFFRKEIINAQIRAEQLDKKEHLITTSHYKGIRDKYFYPIIKNSGKADLSGLLEDLKKIKTYEKFTLKSGKFLLSHLLGDFASVRLKEPLLHEEQISIQDIIYQLILNSSPYTTGIPILEHKKKLDELSELKGQLKDYQARNEENLFDEEIKELEEQIQKKKKETAEEKSHIEQTIKDFRKKEQPKLRKQIGQVYDERLNQLKSQRNKLKAEFKKKFCLIRFLKFNQYKEGRDLIDVDIQQNTEASEKTGEVFDRLTNDIIPLLEIKKELEDHYNHLQQGIQSLLDIQFTFGDEFDNSSLANYLFINHVIDQKILKRYFSRHKEELLRNLSDSLKKILTETSFSPARFKEEQIQKIDDTIRGIIDFRMTDYLLNRYDELELLKIADLRKDVASLIKVSVPFFNADNSFTVNNSHSLVLHHKSSEADLQNLRTGLKKIFPIVPQQIDTLNPNKFSLLKIDVIPDLTSLVKYNMGRKRMELMKTADLQ